MKKSKKFKVGILIIGLFFTLLYFSIQFDAMTLNINDETIGKKNITPVLSDGKSITFEWKRTWGGDYDDYGYGVAVDSSSNVYLTGYTESFGAGGYDMVLMKYEENSAQQWYQTWGGGDDDYGCGVAVDSSGNVYLTGSTYSFGTETYDIVLVKYDDNGAQQWNRTWDGGDDDYGRGVVVDSSGDVYLTGSTYSFGIETYEIVLVKYDDNGAQQWNRTWGGDDDDYGCGVTVDLLSNVYLTGFTASFGTGAYDIVLVKYDDNGAQKWNCTWGGVDNDNGYGIAADSSGNVYLTGFTESFGTNLENIVMVKYDDNGTQQWNRTWGGVFTDIGYGVAVDSSNNVYITGYTYSLETRSTDTVLLKYDRNGRKQWDRTWGGHDLDVGYGVAMDSSGNVYLAGFTNSFGAGDVDIVLVKYSYTEKPPSDDLIMILIIIVSIASVVGVGIAITFFIRRRRKIVE